MTEKNKNGEKVLFSWRAIQGEDGSIRTESYADPEWKESGPGQHGLWGHRRGHMGSMGPMGSMGMRFRKRRMGREKTRDMLDWFEAMYDEFYGRDEPADSQSEA